MPVLASEDQQLRLIREIEGVGEQVAGFATHYGEQYNGLPLACGGTYSSEDESIIAVGPHYYGRWPCGTTLEVCGGAGCIVGTRVDSCPGCGAWTLDLSESGLRAACGEGARVCEVTFRQVIVHWRVLENPPDQGEHEAQYY